MRSLLCALIWCLLLPASALADGPRMRVHVDGPLVVGETVGIVVEARAAGARLTFPDLQGELGTSACALNRARGVKRFVLPYRPAWAGTHMLTVSATAGGCGRRPHVSWRPLVLEVAPAPESQAAGLAAQQRRSPCRGAAAAPIPRSMRAARLALVCLLNAERLARGLEALEPSPALRHAASRKAHRPDRGARRGEHVLAGTGEGVAPAGVLSAWLGADAHRLDLLGEDVRSVGVAVVPGPRGPMRRLGATWVLEVA